MIEALLFLAAWFAAPFVLVVILGGPIFVFCAAVEGFDWIAERLSHRQG
ncbi:MAG: hypothetical protein Q8R82_19335 [Hyphomonadaceae bacterium]|nr:hypothetical protein [Hyphomonadaceae bacterium]